MNGSIVAIYVTPQAGATLTGIDEAELEVGVGIVGDRYHSGTGTFWKKLQKTRDFEVTLIESEEIARFNDTQLMPFEPHAFRRNIVTSDIRLNDLVGRQFRIAEIELEGVRLCEPCAYLAKRLGPEVRRAMKHRAGLRARILRGGIVRPGDAIGATASRSQASTA